MPLNEEELEYQLTLAFSHMEKAEDFENGEDWASAIFNYQEAAGIFKKCGLPRQKLDEIYDRIADLNSFNIHQKEVSAQEPGVDPEVLQNQAFELIDNAKLLEKNMEYSQAIENYMQAVQLLMQAGWDSSQLQNFQSEVQRVQQLMVNQAKTVAAPVNTEFVQSGTEEYTPTFGQVNNSQPSYTPQAKTNMVPSSESNVDALQNQGFKLIDMAKELKEIGNYKESIDKYYEALQKLVEAGWKPEQLTGFQIEIEKIGKLIIVESPTIQSPQSVPQVQTNVPTAVQTPFQSTFIDDSKIVNESKANVEFFELKKQMQVEYQDQAFSLLDEAKLLERDSQYKNAIDKYKASIELLNKIGWVNETSRIYDAIENLNKKIHDGELIVKSANISSNIAPIEEKLSEIKEELPDISIFTVSDFEQKRMDQEEKQTLAFNLMDSAETSLKNKQFDEAIADYNRSIVIFNQLGWYDYTPRINDTIKNVIEQKEAYELYLKNLFSGGSVVTKGSDSVYNEMIEKETKIRKTKLANFELDKGKEDRLQDLAFSLISEGQDALKNVEFELSLKKYNQALEILIGIGWQDQIQQLTSMIAKILHQKQQSELLKQQEKIQRLESKKLENEFEARLSDKISEEISQVGSEDAEAEKFEDKRKQLALIQKEALRFIDEANKCAHQENPEYDLAIELFKQASGYLTQAGWGGEINYVNDMIVSVQNEKAKYEEEIRIKLELKDQQDEANKIFTSEIKKQIEDFENNKALQQKNLLIVQQQRDKTKESENKAFAFMDKAEIHLASNNYMDAAESYYNAMELFKTLGWDNQIKYIEHEIEKMYDLDKKKNNQNHLLAQVRENESRKREQNKLASDKKKEDDMFMLGDISSMIKAASSKNEEKKIAEKFIKEEEKVLYQIRETKKVSQKESLFSLRDSIRQAVNVKSKAIEDKKIEMKDDLDDFKRMIKEAAEKSKKNN